MYWYKSVLHNKYRKSIPNNASFALVDLKMYTVFCMYIMGKDDL